jgi:HlyD family secretion protein
MKPRNRALRCQLTLMATTILLAACAPETGPLPIVGTLERDRLELVAEAHEPIVELVVREGDRVSEGQLLLRLDASLHATRLAQGRAARERAEQRYAELLRGPRPERIAEARARLDGARENLATQRREHDRIEGLIERNLASPADLDRAYARRELAEAEYRQAEAALAELIEGTTAEELAQARAAADEAIAALQALEIAGSRLALRAPRAGQIEALPFRLGERPPQGGTVAVMLADGAPYARVYVPAEIRAHVTPGLAAEIRIDGLARSFSGTVRFVAADAAYSPYYALTQRDRSRLSYRSEIVLDEPEALTLPTGVPVEVDFPSLRDLRGGN